MLLENFNATKYTGAARTLAKFCTTGKARNLLEHTAGAARQPTKDNTSTAKYAVEHKAEHAALHTLTKDITSAASKTIDISMIGAASFNHLVQKSQQNLKI